MKLDLYTGVTSNKATPNKGMANKGFFDFPLFDLKFSMKCSKNNITGKNITYST